MKLTQNRIVGITAVLIILACFFAIYLRLFTQKELWYEMFAAVLGVIITAIITMILLRGQSDNDVERERASKVFEEKLRIYQEYLQTLYDVIKDTPIRDKIAISCMLRQIHEFSSHAIRHGLYIKNRKRLFCP